MLMAEKEVEEAKTLLLEEGKMANPLIDKADFKDMVMEKLDFSTPIKQSNLVEAIVKKIVPNTTLDFTWYLNLFPRQEGCEDRDYRAIKTSILRGRIPIVVCNRAKNEVFHSVFPSKISRVVRQSLKRIKAHDFTRMP